MSVPSLRDLAILSKDFRTSGIAGTGIAATVAIVLLAPELGVSDAAVSSGVTAIGVIVLGVAGRGGTEAWAKAKQPTRTVPAAASQPEAVVVEETTDPGATKG